MKCEHGLDDADCKICSTIDKYARKMSEVVDGEYISLASAENEVFQLDGYFEVSQLEELIRLMKEMKEKLK